MSHFVLRDGEPVVATLNEWSAFFESPARFIADDRIGSSRVVTIFEGIDAFGEGCAYFFTATFRDGALVKERRTRRRSRALAYHAALLSRVRSRAP